MIVCQRVARHSHRSTYCYDESERQSRVCVCVASGATRGSPRLRRDNPFQNTQRLIASNHSKHLSSSTSSDQEGKKDLTVRLQLYCNKYI